MTQERPFEEILDVSVERALAGEPLDNILRDYPPYAETLRPLLAAAAGVTAASAEATAASRESRALALNGMVAAVETERSAGRSRADESGGVGTMMGWFRSRPLAGALALLGGFALLGAVAAGASAAGTGPKPVREFFGFQSDSSIRVEFEGVIRGVDTASRALTVESGADVRTVIVTDATELSDGGDAIAFDSLTVGQLVEVKGTLQVDNTILASRVHREDEFDDDDITPSATQNTGTPVPNATPFDDSDDRDDDDHSGPGGGGDDDGNADDHDNSGPGSGDDDPGNHDR